LVCLAPTAHALPGWLKDAIKSVEGIQVHEDAPALIILKEERTRVSDNGKARTRGRYAVKILKSSGEQHAVFSHPIRERVQVTDLQGWWIQSNGRVSELERDYIVELSLGDQPGRYDDLKNLLAAFPNVEVGDIVAFEYKMEEKDAFTAYHQGFVFQELSPVASSRFELEIPKNWLTHFSAHFADPIQFERDGNKFVWTTDFLQYRPTEPYMPPLEAVYRQVNAVCYHPEGKKASFHKDWPSLSRFGWDLHDAQAIPTDTIQKLVQSLTRNDRSSAEKVTTLAHFVRDDIRYVAIEIGEGALRPRVAESVLLNRYGDCKDKTTLLRAMLQAADIPSFPVMARIGGIIDTSFPSFSQFNHCIAALPLDSIPGVGHESSAVVDNWLLFDPTRESIDLGTLPPELYGTPVLPMSPGSLSVYLLPPYHPDRERTRYQAVAAFPSENELSADVSVTSYHALAQVLDDSFQSMTRQEQISETRDMFDHCMQSPTITDLQVASHVDSMSISFRLKGEHYLSDAGDMRLLKANCFQEDPVGIKDIEMREFPIWMGSPQSIETSITWHLSAGWTVLDDPVRLTDSCALGSIDCRTTVTDSTLGIDVREIYYGAVLPPEQFRQAKDFLDMRRTIHSMRIMLARQ
jgi:hypothetical protein